MSTQRLIWHEGQRYTGIDSWGHETAIDADQAGTGAKPSDMLPLSLAACTAYDVVSILRKQRQDVQGLEAAITSEQEPDAPWRFLRIAIAFTVRGDVDPRKAEKALVLSHEKSCSVAATLRGTVAMEFTIEVVP